MIGGAGEAGTSACCERCLARPWLLARLGMHLDRARARIEALLALPDLDLIDAVGGKQRDVVRSELGCFDPDRARREAVEVGVELVCRCDDAYPVRLRDLDNAPAVLHVVGSRRRFSQLLEEEPVAVVGARRASEYGLGLAEALGRGLGAAGVTVLSGMAVGIDCAAHTGALSVEGGTVAVLPCGPEHPYPRSKRRVHRRIIEHGAVVSELPPGSGVFRWAFPARNRIIAGLAAMTVVVEAGDWSGALVTARIAASLGRPLGAVPGRVGTSQAAGPNGLLAAGASVVRGAQDVLDALYGSGVRRVDAAARAPLAADLERLLAAVRDGHDTVGAIARAGFTADAGLSALAALELGGYVRRGPGGRFVVV
jgi:DNA processing protein